MLTHTHHHAHVHMQPKKEAVPTSLAHGVQCGAEPSTGGSTAPMKDSEAAAGEAAAGGTTTAEGAALLPRRTRRPLRGGEATDSAATVGGEAAAGGMTAAAGGTAAAASGVPAAEVQRIAQMVGMHNGGAAPDAAWAEAARVLLGHPEGEVAGNGCSL